jgi:Zn-dependent M28 family amino/carboxypeptidase
MRGGAEVGESANVVATLPGTGDLASEVIVFGAHYDHLGERGGEVYPGAEDNASGVAVVLETARVLAAEPAPASAREVLFVFFGAEEVGLVGSRHYVQHPVRPLDATMAMVNIDMIGRPLADEKALALVKALAGVKADASIGVLGTADRPAFRAAVEAACDAQSLQLWAPEDLPKALEAVVDRLARGRGDSFSFEDAGVPALFFGAGESDDYHRPTDTPDKLHYPLLTARARAIADVVRRLRVSPQP